MASKVYFSQLPDPVRLAVLELETAVSERARAERAVSDASYKVAEARTTLANAIASVAAPV